MLLRGREFLSTHVANRTAVAGFVAYNLETAQGIVAAAQATGAPVLLQAGSSPFAHAGWELASIALRLAHASDTAIGVHLDHSRSLDEIDHCLRLGYSSIMVDGSHLPFEENVALTREAVRHAHDSGAWAEAELGAIAGDEDVSAVPDSAGVTAMTDPAQAVEFVERTGVDALAVAVGNVHGFTASPPFIDLERLFLIQAVAGVPLVLHGASGLADDVLHACLDRGVAKVNVNTELRRAYLAAVANTLDGATRDVNLVAVLAAGRDAVARSAASIVRQLNRMPVGVVASAR